MPGFPLMALGAGLGQFAKQYQEQQAQRERQQMLMLTLQKFAQEQQDRQRERQGEAELSRINLGDLGGTGIRPAGDVGMSVGAREAPSSGIPGAGVGMPISRVPQDFGTPGEYGMGQPIRSPIAGGSMAEAANLPGSPIATRQNPTPPPPRFTMNQPGPEAYAEAEGPGAPGMSPTPMPANIPPPRSGASAPTETRVADAAQPPAAAAPSPSAAASAPGLEAEIAKIPVPSVPRIDVEAVRQRINQAAPNAKWERKEQILRNYIAQHGPEATRQYDQAMKVYEQKVGIVTEQYRHSRDRQEKLDDESRAPGPIVRGGPGGDTPYIVNPKKRTAAPIIDETTGKPLADAQRLGGGGASSLSGDRARDLVTETKRLDDEFREANPNAGKAEIDAAHYNNRLKAEQRLAQAKTSETRSSLANIAMRKLRDEHPEWDGKDLLRESSKIIAQQAIDRRYAGGQGANQMTSLNTVADHLKLMQEYSEALRKGDTPFTEIPRLNQLIQRIAVERGLPEVTNFNVARDIMADEVVRLLTSTGGTEADRAGMQSRLSAMMSEYQQTGSLTAFERFVAGRFKGLEQGYARNDPERVKDFRENLLTPEARAIFTRHGGVESGGAPQPGARPGSPPAKVPPPQHIELLKQQPTPERRQQFDEAYGVGAAARALGQ